MSAPGFLTRLSHRDRRALIIGAAILVPALLWVGAVRPYRDALVDVSDRIETERALLAREEGLLLAADRMPDDLNAAAASAERAERRLVGTSNTAVAEADVTEYIESLATKSRVLLTEIRGMGMDRKDHPPAGLQIVRIAVQGESDLNGVTGLLRRLEDGMMLIRVSELTAEPAVERRRTVIRGSQATTESTRTGYLNFNMVIEAYAPADSSADANARKESRP
jgi:hypothetical protein